MRQAAYKSFRQSTAKFGVLLGRKEVLRQYRRYNDSVKEDAGSRRLLSLILDCLELAAAKEKVQREQRGEFDSELGKFRLD